MRIGSGSSANRQAWAKSREKIVSGAAEIFHGPQQSGTQWAAVFLQATDNTAAFQDYVQRNIDKFSGDTLKAMLISTDLVDWYKERQQKQLADAAKSISEKIDALQEAKSGNRFFSRLRLYTPSATTTGSATPTSGTDASTTGDSAAAGDGGTAADGAGGVDVTV